MRHLRLCAIAGWFAIFWSLDALAGNFSADDSHASCQFLAREDFGAMNVTKDVAFVDSDWPWDEIPKEMPDTKNAVTDLCSATVKKPGGEVSITLAVERFDGNITEKQVEQWLKSVAKAESSEGVTSKTSFNEIVCESGNYELLKTQEDGSSKNINEFYVACDAQVDTRHISLNVHVPEAEKTSLPSLEETKGILDKSMHRLKATAQKQQT